MDEFSIPENLEKCNKEIVCRQCGLIQTVDEAIKEHVNLRNGGFHIRLNCSACGAFLKFQQHSKNQILHFGKYKNKDISWIAENDQSYLYSLLKWKKLKNSTRESIENSLSGGGRDEN